MPSHLLSFVVMGIAQLALTVYGEYLAVKSLPPGKKRRPQALDNYVVSLCVPSSLTKKEIEDCVVAINLRDTVDLASAKWELPSG
jgi:hypothetical protein